MPNYRRAFQPGGTFFLTLVTQRRATIFKSDTARTLLRQAIEHSRKLHPFALQAIVLLHDHLNLLITLPDGDADFSRRIASIKSTFTRHDLGAGGTEQSRSHSRVRQRTRGVWQRRFWEHTIRDETDRHRHLDYIHYNAVKHGYVDCPHAWPHSTFHQFVSRGLYERDWQSQCEGRVAADINFDYIAKLTGE